ncbi:hypothetical protein [Actinopolymorpha sp. B9G3]|uniref:hypothetical protein n=1 Tax=Actinopolymorpha sp. B9G3 TaxID=3158970 RepID=UPI0032D912A8
MGRDDFAPLTVSMRMSFSPNPVFDTGDQENAHIRVRQLGAEVLVIEPDERSSRAPAPSASIRHRSRHGQATASRSS